MERKSFIVEGAFDAELISKILPDDILSKIDILNGGGSTSSISKARTLMAAFDKNIVILLDTDTTNERRIEEQKGEIEFLLNDVAKNKNAYHLILASPELEVILFRDKALADSIFKQNFTETEIELARFSPRKAVEKKLGKPFNDVKKDLLSGITEPIAQELRKTDLIQKIEQELLA